MKPAILYISYDGMMEPLGQSQVIAYLERLTDEFDVSLISFEKKEDRKDPEKRAKIAKRLAGGGIRWTMLAYHKTPSAPATAFDIAVGTMVALYLTLTRRVQIVHARSYVPALMAMSVKFLTGAKFLFDMRGFWADERLDGGIWPRDSKLYRVTKWLEKKFLTNADHVVTLTHASIVEMKKFPYLKEWKLPVSVVTTCADLDRFNFDPTHEPKEFVFGYVGSIGTWYLFDDVLDCFKLVRESDPTARLLIVNRNEHAQIAAALSKAGIAPELAEVVSADHSQVPGLIRRMTIGAAIIKPAFSKISSAPTKLAEYLGCGVPCLGNHGVGDVGPILEEHMVGVALTDMSIDEKRSGVRRLMALAADPQTRRRCRDAALALFSLNAGVDSYRGIYHSLCRPSGPLRP